MAIQPHRRITQVAFRPADPTPEPPPASPLSGHGRLWWTLAGIAICCGLCAIVSAIWWLIALNYWAWTTGRWFVLIITFTGPLAAIAVCLSRALLLWKEHDDAGE